MPYSPVPPRPARRATLVLVLAGLALLGTLAVLAVAPPTARGKDAPAREFSAARAFTHVRAVAQRPHPLGTRDNARVRHYLADTARSLGAEVRVESGDVVRTDLGSPFPAGTAHNVVAKVPGTAPRANGGKALLLVAHHDSAPTGPGAADDGAALGALLETMRALKAHGGVPHDVVFLFTDGEEIGSLGAELFLQRHGLDAYPVVLNWEARGSRGPVTMFETSTGNGPLIDAFARSADRPVATSLAYEVYKRMPNGSDFTLFRGAGATGLNSAFLHGFHDYHSPRDTPARLDPDSVQHQGDLMLGLVRTLGESDLRQLRGQDSVYFDLFARVLVRYPATWAAPLAALTLLALGWLLLRGLRRSALRPSSVAAVAGAGFAAVALAGAAALGLWQAVLTLRPGIRALPMEEPYDRGWFIAGFLLLLAAALLAAGRILRGRRPAEYLGGALTAAAALLAATVLTVPGASYLTQWPLLAGLPALWWACREPTPTGTGRLGLPLTLAAPTVAVILFAPLVDSLLVSLGVALGAVAVVLAGAGALLLLPLLARAPRPGLAALATTVLALLLVAGGIVAGDFGPRQPRPNALVYVRDLTRDSARWLSADPAPDAWTRRVLGDHPGTIPAQEYFPGYGDASFLQADAPRLTLPAPTVKPLETSVSDGVRRVRFQVMPGKGAWQVQVRLARQGLRSCRVVGTVLDSETLRRPGQGTDGVVFQFTGIPDGTELTCDTHQDSPLRVEVWSLTLGLPPTVESLVGRRPAGTMAAPYGFAPVDTALVHRTVTL